MKRIFASLGLAIGIFLCASPAAASIVVTFSPSAQHVDVGGTVKVDVNIAGVGADILSGYDLNFRYSGSLLQWVSTDESSALAQLGTLPFVMNDPFSEGDLGMFAVATDDDETLALNQADNFLLFQFQLKGVADGVTTFGLGSDPYFDRNFLGRLGVDGWPASLNVSVGSACIAVGTGECSVPEPASYALLGLGLIAAFAPSVRRRRPMP
jgi:hypothetical protein